MGIQAWEISKRLQEIASGNHQKEMRAKHLPFIPKVFFRRKCCEFYRRKQSSSSSISNGGEQESEEGEVGITDTDCSLQSSRNEVIGVCVPIYGQTRKQSEETVLIS